MRKYFFLIILLDIRAGNDSQLVWSWTLLRSGDKPAHVRESPLSCTSIEIYYFDRVSVKCDFTDCFRPVKCTRRTIFVRAYLLSTCVRKIRFQRVVFKNIVRYPYRICVIITLTSIKRQTNLTEIYQLVSKCIYNNFNL